MDIVIIIGTVVYEKTNYGIGEVLSVEEADGQRLINLGVAILAEDKVTESKADDEDEANPNPPGATEPLVDIAALTRDDLARELSVLGIPFKQSASRDHLVHLYKEATSK